MGREEEEKVRNRERGSGVGEAMNELGSGVEPSEAVIAVVGRPHIEQKTQVEEHLRINAIHCLFLPPPSILHNDNWPTPAFYTSHMAHVTRVKVPCVVAVVGDN